MQQHVFVTTRSTRAQLLLKFAGLILCGLASWFLTNIATRHFRREPAAGLRALRDTVRVHGPDSSAEKGLAYFHLVNDSAQQIILEGAETSCTCTVASDVTGVKIPPGHTHIFPVKASLPKYGLLRSDLRVFYSPSRAPLVLHIEAAGELSIPAVERIVNGSPLFLDLRSVDEFSDVTVITKEEIGSARWLKGLSCNIPGFKSQIISVDEEVRTSLGLVERCYRFQVGWNRLPTLNDFKAKLFADLGHGQQQLYIGIVFGNVVREGGQGDD
jgi:hypothetical protein